MIRKGFNNALTKPRISRAASVAVAAMRMTRTAPSAVARASRCPDTPVRNSLSGPGPDQEPHHQPEIVAGDVHQAALLQVLAATPPRAAHAAAVEGEGEATLDQL